MRIDLTGALPPLAGDETLIFTSRHGVAGFCRLTDRRDLPCYAVGEATAQAARAAGMVAVACGGDARALVQRIARDGASGPFLHPRGAHVAADIAGALRAAGHDARDTVVYDQQAQPLSAAARAALAGPDPVILPLMSPRSGQLFFAGAGDPGPASGRGDQPRHRTICARGGRAGIEDRDLARCGRYSQTVAGSGEKRQAT